MEHEIRLGIGSDAETIAAYHHQCRLKAFAQILPEGTLDGYPADGSLDRWRKWLSSESDPLVQVVSVDGVAVAHVVTLGNEILHLFVDPNHWGQGLGRLLLGVGEKELARQGHQEIQLHTMVGNTPAIN
jgi:ribosomal protein S18 acetylase RimI-like enzyme